jgi:nicotinamide riboside kinase
MNEFNLGSFHVRNSFSGVKRYHHDTGTNFDEMRYHYNVWFSLVGIVGKLLATYVVKSKSKGMQNNVKPVNEQIRKIAVVGPESTGKSELSEFLARHYETAWVPEYARGYLDNLIRPYEKEDLTTIANGQQRLEETWSTSAKEILICDTNLLVIKVWSNFKYGETDPEILKALQESHYDLYLLTNIDIPWKDDPQREHPERREELYSIYLTELKAMNVPFVEIRGERKERQKVAIEAIDRLLINEHQPSGTS